MSRTLYFILFWVLILLGLYVAALYSYLLFHTVVELFSIAVAWLMFGAIWAASDRETDGLYVVLGTGYLFVGFMDLVHTLAYKGMNVFVGYDANLPTQLWICARYMESFTLLGAQFYVKKKIHISRLVLLYAGITGILLTLVFSRIFPDCYLEGKGLTSFKIVSEVYHMFDSGWLSFKTEETQGYRGYCYLSPLVCCDNLHHMRRTILYPLHIRLRHIKHDGTLFKTYQLLPRL